MKFFASLSQRLARDYRVTSLNKRRTPILSRLFCIVVPLQKPGCDSIPWRAAQVAKLTFLQSTHQLPHHFTTMEQPIASIEHLKAIEGHPEARPLDLNPSPSTSTSQSLSPANASPRPTLPSSPSALSISRPPPLTRPSAVPVSTFTAASTRNPSPSPQGQTTPQPVLLNSLTASDGESILCIAVEEDDQDVEGARGRKEREREQGGVKTGGKVYGGSQGGDIHVSQLRIRDRSWLGATSCGRLVPFSSSFRTFC